jgi:hypothetical protein
MQFGIVFSKKLPDTNYKNCLEMTMKQMTALFLTLWISFAVAQENVPYFQPPYFERWYSPLELSELATLDVTLAIREAVQHLDATSDTLPSFTFVSRQDVTSETHDLIERIFSPIYAGDTAAFREWLETYYTQEALADEMQIYFTDSYYDEALAGSDDYFDTKDFADALTMYLTMSYIIANHLVDGTPAEYDLAAREQVRAALATSPRFAALNDADKQRGTLLLLFFLSYAVGDFNRALESNTCAANDSTPGPSKATFYCGKYTEVDLVSTFAESVAQIFGFRVRDFVLTGKGFESANE